MCLKIKRNRYKKIGLTRAHRVIWENAFGKITKGCIIHHKNQDKADNRIENLECMTRAQHQKIHAREIREGVLLVTEKRIASHRRESKRKGNYTSKYKGVKKQKNSWIARICPKKGVRVYLGSFDNELSAAIEYDLAALKYFGKDANLNCLK